MPKMSDKADLGGNQALTGRITSLSRRAVWLLDAEGNSIVGRLASGVKAVVAGDRVTYRIDRKAARIEQLFERKNCLKRALGTKTRLLAANLDLMLIMASIQPALNTTFVDRALLVARLQSISCQLIINKIDLGQVEAQRYLQLYGKLDVPILCTSAQTGEGMDVLERLLSGKDLNVVVLVGVSGVGKTTILNYLVPEAQQRTAALSDSSGQGRQTTSQAIGHCYGRERLEPLLLIDLPGFNNFGVSDLTPQQARFGFVEFETFAQNCEYADCQHWAEPNCAVKAALSDGLIAQSRYDSYLGVLNDIERARPY